MSRVSVSPAGKLCVYLCFVLVAVAGMYSCTEIPDREEQLNKTIYTNTLLRGGSPFESITLFLMDGGSTLIPARNLLGILETPDGSFLLHEVEPGVFKDTTAQAFLYYDAEVRFRALGLGFDFEAITVIPPANSWTTEMPASLEIQSDNPSDILFAPQWSMQDGLEYIVTLEFLDEPGDPLPFNGDFSSFQDNFRYPITTAGFPLYAGYFQYSGQYKLSVFGVPETYAELYFSTQLQQSALLAENIQGGTGIFQGANVLEWTFQILPQ